MSEALQTVAADIPRRRRALRALAWAGIVLAAGQAAAGVLIDACPIRHRFRLAGQLLDQMGHLPAPPAVLFAGTSRIQFGIRTDVVRAGLHGCAAGPVFNASVNWGDSVYVEYLLQQAEARGIVPSVLVTEVSPDTLARPNRGLKLHIGRQMTWPEMWREAAEIVASGNLKWLAIYRLNAVYGHREELRTWAAAGLSALWTGNSVGTPTVIPPADASFAGIPDLPRDERLRFGRDQFAGALRDFRPDGQNARALDRLLQHCRSRGIRLIVAVFPVSGPHRTLYSPEVERRFAEFVSRRRAEFGFRFVDCRDWIDDDFFADSGHLAPEGASRFSERFVRDVLEPEFRAGPSVRTSAHAREGRP